MSSPGINYIPLEDGYTGSLGVNTPSYNSAQPATFGASLSFLFTLGVMVCVAAGGFMYMRAGAIRIKASESAIRKSNEEIKRVTLGLVGVLSLFVIIYTLNKDLLNVDVPLSDLRAETGGTGLQSLVSSSNSGAQSASCSDPKTLATTLTSGGNICGNTSCTLLANCKYKQYLPLIDQAAQAGGVDPSVVVAVMCKESHGDVQAVNKNANGTFDCGLMQINQQGGCDPSSLDPATNISKGVQKLKASLSGVQVYPNIKPELGAFASYNCCSNGTVPNAPSGDCTQASGFPYTIPKWACPINPGSGTSNMCSVKSYACDIEACVLQLDQ